MKLIWYFDFISPFAYLQHSQFARLPDKIQLEYRPILFAGLLNHWQNVGPAEVPPKRIFTYQHCYWKAKTMGIPFKMPPAHPFNSLAALRLALAMNCDPTAIQVIFDAIWREGYALDSTQANEYLTTRLDCDNIEEKITDPGVKRQLRDNTDQAIAHSVFGVPTFIVAANPGQLFWGLDAFDMLLDYLNDPVAFNDTQMRQIVNLPEGIQRKR